jgi:threonine aldolase
MPTPLDFRSDNVATAAPEILEAMVAANRGTAAGYGADELSRQLDARFSELFETAVRVFPVATGTAANALSLAAITPSYGGIYCYEQAHIHTSECGATEFSTGGAKLHLVGGTDFKISPTALTSALDEAAARSTTTPPPAVLSITQASEWGTVYRLKELDALTGIARAWALRVHIDGARLANALATLGCTPAEMSWRRGADILSFGATKNGAMSADAIVVFRPEVAEPLAYRLRRAGLVWSKMRFAAAQLLAYVKDDLWLRHARRANALAARLASSASSLPGVRLAAPVEANEVFLVLGDSQIAARAEAGLLFNRRAGGIIRLVCRFDGTDEEVDACLALLRQTADRRAAE